MQRKYGLVASTATTGVRVNILAMDTSSPRVAVALRRSDGEVVEQVTAGDRPRHVEDLVRLLGEVMKTLGVAREDIGRLAVGVGPGQFNGLRVGVTTARMLQRVWQIPLVGVESLEAMAWPFRNDAEAVTVLLDARRHSVYLASYRTNPWKKNTAATMCDIDAVQGYAIGSVIATPSVADQTPLSTLVGWPSATSLIEISDLLPATNEATAARYLRPPEEVI